MNILCIDDNPTYLEIFKSLLEPCAQFEDNLYFVDNADTAFDILNNKPIQLVITDLVMPEKTGIDVLLEAKKIDPSIQVVVITGMGSVESAVQAMHLGARDYLQKPINADLLQEKIDKIREYVELMHNAEDYRFAKETFEAKAGETIHDMELKLNRCLTLIDTIYKIARQEDEHKTRITNIISAIDQFNTDF